MKISARKINNASENRKKQIISILSRRFNYDMIINEQFYIKNMSPNMGIKKQILLRDEIFTGIEQKQAETILKSVPFFQVGIAEITIQYPDANQKVVVTGIKQKVLKQWLETLSKQTKEYRKNAIIKETNLHHWHILEFNNYESASGVKRFLRNKKLEKDLESTEFRGMRDKKPSENYKFQSRRVRIVLLNEDFFTILVDQINQSLNEEFLLSIQSNTMRNDVRIFKNLIYLSVSASPTSEQRQEDIEQEYSSQLNSQTSSIRDNRMNEIDVQTSNIGTQIQAPIYESLMANDKQTLQQGHEKEKQKFKERENGKQVDQQKNSERAEQKCKQDRQVQDRIKGCIQQKGQNENRGSDEIIDEDARKETEKNKNTQEQTLNKIKEIGKQQQTLILGESERLNCTEIIGELPQQPFTIQIQEQKKEVDSGQIGRAPRMEQDFPQLGRKRKESEKRQEQEQNQYYLCLSYNEIMKKYKKYLQQNKNREFEFVTIPPYIKKQADAIKSKKMFHEGVIKQGQKLLLKIQQQY